MMRGRTTVVLALLLQGGVTAGCDADKTETYGTGGGGGDTGGGDDTGGTSETGPTEIDEVFRWMDCVPQGSVTEGHFDEADYEDFDTGTEDGTECRCRIDLIAFEGEAAIVEVSDVRVRGPVNGSATPSESTKHPLRHALEVPWNAPDYHHAYSNTAESGQTEWNTAMHTTYRDWHTVGTHDDGVRNNTASVELEDEIQVWLPLRQRRLAGDSTTEPLFGSCSDYDEIQVKLVAPSSVAADDAPPPRAVNPLGTHEADMACSPGTSGTTSFALVDFPQTAMPQPIGIAGTRNYLESELTQVSVTAWNNADQLIVTAVDGTQVTLTPSSSSASLPSGTFWFGNTTFAPGRTADGATWTHPRISMQHSCPTTRTNGNRPKDQGYAVSLSALDSAIDAATGGAGLPDLVTGAPQTGWPIYVARVQKLAGTPASGTTHALVLEVQGTWAMATLPLEQTALGRWDLDHAGSGWTVTGKVARNPGNLTLELTGGSVGPLSLTPTTVVLPVYP